MRNVVIHLRALPEERDLIDRAAKLLGKSRSNFMLEAVCEHAQAVLRDQVDFALDAKRFNQCNAMLDASSATEPNAGFQKLMTVQAPWLKGA